MQCFLAALRTEISSESDAATDAPLTATVIDAAIELTLWSPGSRIDLSSTPKLWHEIIVGGALDEFEVYTTPKLYGSKERLTDVLFGVAMACLPAGAPVLDLMSGTGIVSRKYAARHPVTANDANPYAALLTRAQGISLDPNGVTDLMHRLRAHFDANLDGLRRLVASALEEEAAFLHGDLDAPTLDAYASFCSRIVLPPEAAPPPTGSPHQLCTARYANAYFGVAQATEIDSLRAAIETTLAGDPPMHDLCLAALVIAACICNSGPHFAQPPKIASIEALREIIEHRARSVFWEFELALKRLAARRPLAMPFGPVTALDWRKALESFTANLSGARPAAVYLDPPYSKLQYSRYYHVLNVLIAYDYPPCLGVGRYPPLAQRFSSRFEYQPRAAERELSEVFMRCSNAGLHLIVSYGDRGFLPIADLIRTMASYFRRVDVFSERIRHHSQGVPLSAPEGKIVEYVIVGMP
jgi:hypothetical protein